MKVFKIGLLISCGIIASIIVFWFLVRVPDKGYPEKFSNIPEEAFWRGSIDEGFWFVLNDIDTVKKKYHFKIFADYNGDLVIDADFKLNKSCGIMMPLNEGIIQRIKYFEFDKILLDTCELEIISPAYGGTFWELGKGK